MLYTTQYACRSIKCTEKIISSHLNPFKISVFWGFFYWKLYLPAGFALTVYPLCPPSARSSHLRLAEWVEGSQISMTGGGGAAGSGQELSSTQAASAMLGEAPLRSCACWPGLGVCCPVGRSVVQGAQGGSRQGSAPHRALLAGWGGEQNAPAQPG